MKTVSKTPSEPTLRISVSLLGVLSLLSGATNDIAFNFFGEIFLAELALMLLAGSVIVLKGSGGAFKAPIFWAFVAVAALTLVGYTISDLYVGSEPSQYLRGWGRVVLLMSDCICLMILTAHSRQNLWWFMLGTGIGGVVFLAYQGIPLHTWKLGYGERIGIIVLVLAPLLLKRFTVAALAAFGVMSIALDYRNLGAAFIVVAAILWARSRYPDKLNLSFSQYARVLLIGGIGVIGVIATIALTRDEYAARRDFSTMSRTAALVVAMRAIADSPVVGHGSWTVSPEYAEMLRREVRERRDPNAPLVALEYRGSSFQSHSQILQSWVEGGIFGAAFFLFYGYQLVRAIRWYMLRRPTDVCFAAFSFMLIIGLWNWIASPFLGAERIQIAMAVSAIAAMAFDKMNRSRSRRTAPATGLDGTVRPRYPNQAKIT